MAFNWAQYERQANDLLSLKDSNHLLCIDGMAKSKSYQYIIRERSLARLIEQQSNQVSTDHIKTDEEFLGYFEDRVVGAAYDCLNKDQYRILEIEEGLVEQFWWAIDHLCTQKQQTVAHMFYLGATQWEIANSLNVNQSGICKTLQGNHEYYRGTVKNYGGVRGQLTKFIKSSHTVQWYMNEMEDILDPNLNIKLPFFATYRKVIGKDYYQWLDQDLS